MRALRWIVRTTAPPLVLLLLLVCVGFAARPAAPTPTVSATIMLVVFAAGAYAADELQFAPATNRRVNRTGRRQTLRMNPRSRAGLLRRRSKPGLAASSDAGGFGAGKRLLRLRT